MVTNLGESCKGLLVGRCSSYGVLLTSYRVLISSCLYRILEISDKSLAAVKLHHERLLVEDVPRAVDAKNFLFLKIAMTVSRTSNGPHVSIIQDLD